MKLLVPVYLDTDAGAKVSLYHNPLVILDLSVTPMDLKQTVQVDKDLVIRAYYAGHVSFLHCFSIFIQHSAQCSLNTLHLSIDLALYFLI